MYLLIAALAIFVGTHGFRAIWRHVTPAPIDQLQRSYGPRDRAEALRMAHREIVNARDTTRIGPTDWSAWESYGRALMRKARITGDYADLVASGEAFNKGVGLAAPRSGPWISDAAFASLIHDLPRLRRDLDQFKKFNRMGDDERLDALALEGDLHFYGGDYPRALDLYGKAGAITPDAATLIRIANWQNRMGLTDAALSSLDAAARKVKGPTRQLLSILLLQMGTVEIQRGHWDEAESLFARADAIFPGNWLNQAHRAQMLAVKGNIPGAQNAYIAILRQHPAPEVMDALAMLYRAQGKATESRQWAARSEAIWQERLKQVPTAAFAHAFEHEMVLGDPRLALSYARANAAARPFGESQVMLGLALIANNQPEQAVRLMQALERTGWKQAAQYSVLSQALALLGRSDAAEAAREQALALNPKVFDPSAPFIWFGH